MLLLKEAWHNSYNLANKVHVHLRQMLEKGEKIQNFTTYVNTKGCI